jgi:serine/threonine-protein kinase
MMAMLNSTNDALQAALRGRYLLEGELGRGGMGVVYLARDLALDRPVAIKLLPPELSRLPSVRARFLQEARTAARLSHPNIVPIYAVEEHDGLVCFVMAYVPGETLAERVRAEGPLPAPAVSRLVQEVAWALAYAHQHQVIHRDVKPENILLERGSGRALVTDFGIARLADEAQATPAGAVMGTPRLVSPEQAAGEPIDGRSDLYSLGVTAFFALTGRYPFEGDSAGQLLAQHLTVPAPPVASVRPGLPRPLATAIDRCLAKAATERFASGEELATALMSPTGNPIPPTLQHIVRELSSFGVDLVGFMTLVVIAIVTQSLTRDFMGFGLNYTAGVAALLVSLLALRGIQVSRLIRGAVQEGWSAGDLATAANREAQDRAAASLPPSSLRRRLLLYGAGAVALTLFWLGPKQWVQSGSFFPVGLLVEVASLALPVALGRWLGQALEEPRDGRPGVLTSFFLRFKSGWLFRVLGQRTGRPAPTSAPDQPTEVLLVEQARSLLGALPPAERERLVGAGTDDLLRRLMRDAGVLRTRLEDLDNAAAAVGGPASPERRAVGESIAHAREDAAGRLGATVAALETLRLELLRARAGISPADGLTENLAALRRLTERIDGAVEAGDS